MRKGSIQMPWAVSSGESEVLPFLYFNAWDQKAYNVTGGTSSAGTNTRVLNQSETNITGASLSSNQITLPAGTYIVNAQAPCYLGDHNNIYLEQDPDGTPSFPIFGENQYAAAGSGGYTTSRILNRKLTITESTVFELGHYITTGKATDGLGSFSYNSNGVSIYAQISFIKIA